MPFISQTTTSIDRQIDTTRRTGASKIFKQAIPKFILDEYPLFVEFVEAYYEWLDQNRNPVEFLQNGQKYFDIDTTLDEFVDHFKKTYLDGFPKNIQIHQNAVLDERNLIKKIRDFYKIKGNQKSIELLFHIISDSETIVEYPREYMFTLSSGNYKDYHQIYLLKDYLNISNGFDIESLKGNQIKQYEGLTVLIASATIEEIHEITRNGKEYYVLSVSYPTGTFIQSDFSPIQIEQNGTVYSHYSVPLVSKINILSSGSDYSVGEFFTIGNTGGQNIKGFISETNELGNIIGVHLLSNPVDYSGSSLLSISSAFGTGASFSIEKSVLSSSIQEYSDNKNLLSKVSKIQDSYEYQQFSYVVKSKRSLEEYTEAIKKLIHPSGFVMFSSLYDNIYSLRPTEYKTRGFQYENTAIGSYAMYELASNTGGGTLAPWNITFLGDPNKTKLWGKVFNFWIPGTIEINPNSPLTNCCVASGLSGEFAPGGLTYAPAVGGVERIYLPNPLQSQVAGITHWIKMPHPATRGMTGIPAGTSFAGIRFEDLFRMRVPI